MALINNQRIIRIREVEHLSGLTPTHIRWLVKQDRFPTPIRICGGKAVGWVYTEVFDWVEHSIENNRIQSEVAA